MTLQLAMAAMRRHLAEVAECEADGSRPCRMFPLTNEDTKALLDVADYAVELHKAAFDFACHCTAVLLPHEEQALDRLKAALAKNPLAEGSPPSVSSAEDRGAAGGPDAVLTILRKDPVAVVPVEPTDNQVAAACQAIDAEAGYAYTRGHYNEDDARITYRAMLAARPPEEIFEAALPLPCNVRVEGPGAGGGVFRRGVALSTLLSYLARRDRYNKDEESHT
jgi:hypothetical protein